MEHDYESLTGCWCHPIVAAKTMHGINIVVHHLEDGSPMADALQVAEMIVAVEFEYGEDKDGKIDPNTYIETNYISDDEDFSPPF